MREDADGVYWGLVRELGRDMRRCMLTLGGPGRDGHGWALGTHFEIG